MISKQKKDIGKCVGIIILVACVILIELCYFVCLVHAYRLAHKSFREREPRVENRQNAEPEPRLEASS